MRIPSDDSQSAVEKMYFRCYVENAVEEALSTGSWVDLTPILPSILTEVPTVYPVFRIHDILVWIRIRIRRSMPLTNGSGTGSGTGFGSGCGSGPCCFRHWPSRRQQKTNLE